jgi:hypothetical protein
MPTIDELMALVKCSDGKYDSDGSCSNYMSVAQPTINSTYFPNTVSDWYWSSSLNNSYSNFNGGFSSHFYNILYPFIRLVR